jgi:radical SAM superfamily enzyme YgiQ (UPF0313 family)
MLSAPLLTAGADAAVIGEGEQTLNQIIKYGIQPSMPGVTCMVSSEIITGPPQLLVYPLDSLLPPARDLMPPPSDGVYLMETSRGCPHACTFCEATRFYGHKWRPYSPERVAAEVRRLVEEHNAWIVHFADDNFAANTNRVLDICKQIQHGPLPAFILASARGDDLISDPRLIPALASARILRISVGIETAEPRLAAQVGKPIPLEIYRDAFRRMRDHGIYSVASFIVGLPGETQEIREHAVETAVQIGPDSAQFLPFIPLPGIPLAQGRNGFDPNPAHLSDGLNCPHLIIGVHD